MKPICLPCRRFYRIKKNGVAFLEGMPKSDALAPAGLAAPDDWKPYKLWYGDLWRCPDCGSEIIVGTGQEPLSEHYRENFADTVVAFTPADGPIPQINDC